MTQHGKYQPREGKKGDRGCTEAQQAKVLDALAQHQDSVPSTT